MRTFYSSRPTFKVNFQVSRGGSSVTLLLSNDYSRTGRPRTPDYLCERLCIEGGKAILDRIKMVSSKYLLRLAACTKLKIHVLNPRRRPEWSRNAWTNSLACQTVGCPTTKIGGGTATTDGPGGPRIRYWRRYGQPCGCSSVIWCGRLAIAAGAERAMEGAGCIKF
jgi:hypothetical protein